MGATYQHNYGAFDRALLNSPMMEAAMRKRAERVQQRFVETAAVSDRPDSAASDEDARRWRDSSNVDSGLGGGVNGNRAYGRVTVVHTAALAIEFGHQAKKADGTPGQWVEGKYNLTLALNAAKE